MITDGKASLMDTEVKDQSPNEPIPPMLLTAMFTSVQPLVLELQL